MAQGEIIKGHWGEYKTFRGPNNELTEQQEGSFLEGVGPGKEYKQEIRDNFTWSCVEKNGRLYVVTTYSAPQKGNNVGASYQYVQYSAATPAYLKGTEKSIFIPLPNEQMFCAVAKGEISIQEDWINQFRKEKWSDSSSLERSLELKGIQQEVIADLACRCLYRGSVNDNRGLVIFVPSDRTDYSPSYLRYCRTIMSMVAGCVPVGLRRYLRFATNPDAQDQKKFYVFFAPEGTELSAEQTGFSLFPESFEPSDDLLLAPEIVEVIRRAAAQGPNGIIELCQGLECDQELDTLDLDQYVRYLRQEANRGKELTWDELREYDKTLAVSTLPKKDRERFIDCIRERLGDNTLDSLLEEDPDLQRVSSINQLMEFLSHYSEVFWGLQMRLGAELSQKLLCQCISTNWTLGQIADYSEQMQELRPAAEKSIKIRSKGQSAPSVSALSILDSDAICAHLDNDLARLKEEKCKQFEQKFVSDLPKLIFASSDELSDAVNQTNLCTKEIRTNCLKKLNQAVEVMLADDKYTEGEKRTCCEAVSESLPHGQRNMLNRIIQAWEEDLAERKKRFESMNSFSAYLSLKKEDIESEQILWQNFDKEGDRQNASLSEFQNGYQLATVKSWAGMEDERLILRRFVQEHQMGIWIDSTTSINNLYSEVLAYQELLSGENKVYIWYPGAEEGKHLLVEDVLQTIMLIRKAHRDGHLDNSSELRGCKATLMCLAQAGMLHRGNTEPLNQYLPEAVRRLVPRSPAKKKKLRWQFIAFVEGVVSILIIAALSIALLLPRPAQDDIDADHFDEVPTMTVGPGPSLNPQDDINSAAPSYSVQPTQPLQNEDDWNSPEPVPPEETQPAEPAPTLPPAPQSAELVVPPPSRPSNTVPEPPPPAPSASQATEPDVPPSEPQIVEPEPEPDPVPSPFDAIQITDQNQPEPFDGPDGGFTETGE